jgi:hypothetical protein
MDAVVLMGAGASFGSIGVLPTIPPLGDKLFDALARIPGVTDSIPIEIQDVFTKQGFEMGMASYYKYVGGDVRHFQRELAKYLASFKPTTQSVYCELIQSLNSERVVYSSLNYDILFELAAHSMGLNCAYSSGVSKGSVRLLKIHGSVNFWPNFGSNQIRVGSIKGARTDIEAPVVCLNQEQTLHRCATDSFTPAIAIYASGKPAKTCPRYVQNQYSMWKESVDRASTVAVVGVRVHLPDEHIWSVLGNTKAHVYYFGLGTDRQLFDSWRDVFKKNNTFFIEADFKKSIPDIKRIVGAQL